MNAIRGQLVKLKKARNQIPNIIRDALISEQAFIAQLNRDQLLDGKKADGTNMPDYVQNSKAPSSPGEITLFDTGEFQAGIEPLFGNDELNLLGTDEKTEILVAKYGEILGLNEESLNLLIQKVKPIIQTKVRALI